METVAVTCPSCFESFEVALPPASECPCEVDYDCEVCCRPMVISFADGHADARSLDD
ncbi:CPXCG motif-containing cysteine-rich protein [Verrucomicrobiaceae bacterium R5-34]|uniref:CPXCG motif-containing cysteine-rich protein n=1 Tax=Oceaniferula flava TaxID=2800421 RepID=A0AAE2SF10_9BACT|nr:CPXCG motif-containing cysteine-rich protein [Oceaniferula flavus]MBK1831878.1 CPXCG motif-containing cysteine-rich protein [Verrucomicrobiaceae bacterium R5-34]MBK1855355.1 CPXCG motif-containing cysteine-rich protein [Oceaniferula flavus]MBM1136661.1 CPXCG motif-containing cysteine-rich protein [Oceaniferula flavus]